MPPAPILLWFRQDLRLADNPALTAAIATGHPLLPVFILDETTSGVRPPGGASRWWLHHSLSRLAADLRSVGLPLILRRGPAQTELDRLIAETGAAGVLWNRCYEPGAVRRDEAIKSALKARDLIAQSFNAALLHEPWTIRTGAGRHFQVFTPFWRALQSQGPMPLDLPRPESFPPPPETLPPSDELAGWKLLPTRPDWAGGLREAWQPGEAGARIRLQTFIDDALEDYSDHRNRPDIQGTSRLSPYLHWGEIGPRQIWHALMDAPDADVREREAYLREIAWREFSYNLLFNEPTLPEANLRAEFDAFPWQPDADHLAAWQRGRTGYPIVDAGMRELWHSGYMHNRVRMIVGSFLVKHLLQDWRAGEAWFWDTLVDADLANNAASWQWIAGCGADAAPYFRIFNPILQGEKFDPAGNYVRRWVPELARLPNAVIHQPWSAGIMVLEAAGVRLSETYPKPILDHKVGRQRALEAFASLKRGIA